MIAESCRNIFFCPFKAEAALISANLPECRKITSQSWLSKNTMIFTWNGAGFLPMQKFLDCFPIDKLKGKNIFLFGSACSVDDSHQPGDIFCLSKVFYEQKCFELNGIGEIPQITALTKDTPIVSNIVRQNIFERNKSCLVDQESYYFIEYFKKKQLDARVVRFVSDTPSFPFRLPFAKSLVARFSKIFKKYQNSLIPIDNDAV